MWTVSVPGGAQSAHTSQHANAFPLSLGLVPAAQQAGVTALVVSSNMSVSALGILQVVRALGEANQGPALLNLYTNANNYGWAQILSLGGTATWESWTANTDGNSESHGWGAVGLDGYVRYILGVKPLTAQFGQVQIMPLDFAASLPSASGTLLTDRGQISIEWDRSATLYHLAVTIPVNVTATVYVPQAGPTNTTVNVDGANVTGTLTNGYLGVSGIGAGAHNIQRALATIPPASLAAIPGNTQVSLNWPPSPGATSYVIQRGTSSGQETATVASGVTATNYTDTGLTNGDTYYYVVAANGPVGSSAGSPEASAAPTLGAPGSYWINTVTASAQGWNANANWNPGTAFPNSPQSAAIINNGMTANQTITLNQSITVGSLCVGAPGGSYNVAANGGTLTLDNTPAPASLTQLVTSRGDTISAPIIVNGSLAITNFSANSFALSGNISGAANGITVNGGVTLSGANTYSGGTAVGGGTLLVNNTNGSGTGSGAVTVADGAGLGGAGFISGAVTIQSGGNLTPGSPLGALTFGSSLTLAGGSTTIIAVSQAPLTNAAAVVLGGLSSGGTLVLTNLGATPLQGGDTFTLFSAANYSGAFASVVLPPLHPALAWNTNLLNTAGVVSVAVTTQSQLKPLAVSPRGLVFAGSGGVAGARYYLLGSSNLATPLSHWVPVVTNLFDAGGNFGFTNPPVPGQGQEFYMLEVP